MAESYLRRNDVGYPAQANARGIYAIQIIEHEDIATLQDLVNIYLLALPEAAAQWKPHIVSIEYDNYTTVPPMPVVNHVCTITIFASGTIVAPPT